MKYSVKGFFLNQFRPDLLSKAYCFQLSPRDSGYTVSVKQRFESLRKIKGREHTSTT